MKTTLYCLMAMLGLAAATAASPAGAMVFLWDDFNTYTTDSQVRAAGWNIVNAAPLGDLVETEATWTLSSATHADDAHWGCPTVNGTATTGNFMMSNSSPGEDSPHNPVDTGVSFDLYTPTFSTIGQNNVWLHMDAAAMLNQEGRAIFDIEVTIDGGMTWTNVWNRVAPGRGQIPQFKTLEEAPLTYTRNATTNNADGFHGHMDLDLSACAANAASAQLRIRHYEPTDDWWIKVDNVLIDNVPFVEGSETVFQEDFSNGFGNMRRYGIADTGFTPTNQWRTDGPISGGYHYCEYWPGEIRWSYQGINRLEHPNAEPDFAVIDALYHGDSSDLYVNDWMATPVLDFTNKTEVFLSYEDEIFRYKNMNLGTYLDNLVVLMQDVDGDGPDMGAVMYDADVVLKTIFSYTDETIGPEDGEDPWYAKRLFSVPEAVGRDDVYFAWHYFTVGRTWWAIDSIKVTTNGGQPHQGDANNDGMVNDADATILASHWHVQSGAAWGDGDFNGDGKVDDKDASILAVNWNWGVSEEGDATVPEPSTLVLVLSAVAMAWLGYRRGR
jgi:hypothetical protein